MLTVYSRPHSMTRVRIIPQTSICQNESSRYRCPISAQLHALDSTYWYSITDFLIFILISVANLIQFCSDIMKTQMVKQANTFVMPWENILLNALPFTQSTNTWIFPRKWNIISILELHDIWTNDIISPRIYQLSCDKICWSSLNVVECKITQ